MRILVTGASGFVGRHLAARLAREHDVTGTFRSVSAPIPGCRLERAELLEPESLSRLIARTEPELVVHAAAAARPDACEKDPGAARTANVEATAAAAAAAERLGARFFYVSSDLVFDGKSPPYREEDELKPLSLYGETKRDGEAAARGGCRAALVLRLSLIYGWNPHGAPYFCDTLRRAFSEGRSLELFSDEFRSALYAEDAAELVARLAARKANPKTPGGALHLAGPERVSRLRFGELFCGVFGYDQSLIRPARAADSPRAAKRPADCSLDGSRAARLLDYRPRTVAEGLSAMRADGGP